MVKSIKRSSFVIYLFTNQPNKQTLYNNRQKIKVNLIFNQLLSKEYQNQSKTILIQQYIKLQFQYFFSFHLGIQKLQKNQNQYFKFVLLNHIIMLEAESYKTQPIVLEIHQNINNRPQILINQNTMNSNPHVQNIINKTLQTINQTLTEALKNNNTSIYEQKHKPHSFQDDWNLLYFLRVLFYVLVVLKILDLIFTRRRKMDIRQRVYRKYIFSHSQMIRQFDEQDKKVMQTTLSNTIKNAYIEKGDAKNSKKITTKRVNIFETKNEYYQARKSEQGEKFESLQSFLQKKGPFLQGSANDMKKEQIDDQPADLQFQILETISTKTTKGQKQIQIVVQKNIESQITRTTSSGQFQQSGVSVLSVNSNISQVKLKQN